MPNEVDGPSGGTEGVRVCSAGLRDEKVVVRYNRSLGRSELKSPHYSLGRARPASQLRFGPRAIRRGDRLVERQPLVLAGFAHFAPAGSQQGVAANRYRLTETNR